MHYQAEMKSNAWGREGQVWNVDSDLEPADEHDQDGSQAEEGKGVRNNRWGTDFRFSELVLDFRFDSGFGCWAGLNKYKVIKLTKK